MFGVVFNDVSEPASSPDTMRGSSQMQTSILYRVF